MFADLSILERFADNVSSSNAPTRRTMASLLAKMPTTSASLDLAIEPLDRIDGNKMTSGPCSGLAIMTLETMSQMS